MASINNVVRVTLEKSPTLAAYDNVNLVAIFTDEKPLNSYDRYRDYTSLDQVENDFGTNSKAYDYAASFFGTSPNSISADGRLIIAYWRSHDETIAATSTTLVGAELSEAKTIADVNKISDGSFDVTIDGKKVSVTGLDFSSVGALEAVVSILKANATLTAAAVVSRDNDKIVVRSKTTGTSSTITFATAGSTGTDVSTILGLASGTGSVVTNGENQKTLTAETKAQAAEEARKLIRFYGFCFIDNVTTTESNAIATWISAEKVLFYDVFTGLDVLEKDVAKSQPWKIVLSSNQYYRCLYSAAGNRKLAVSYMARTHSVNFNGENTAMTMNLKTLSVPAEGYTQTTIDKAKGVGMDVYTTIKLTPNVLCSSVNGFADNVYNLMAYIDEVQIDVFNFLRSTPTKVPQTERGVQSIVDVVEKTTQRFVRADVFAPGTWDLPDFFGDINVFKRSVLTKGYYVLAGELSKQSQADRDARKSPVIQVAVKNAGAIHEADIIVIFDL